MGSEQPRTTARHRRNAGRGPARGRPIAAAVAAALIVAGLAACSPPSGRPDSVQLQWGGYCRVEVRHGSGPDGSLFLAARYDGIDVNLLSYQDRCGISGVSITAQGQAPVSCSGFDGWQGAACTRYTDPVVGGTWFQVSAPGTVFESGTVNVFNAITDVGQQFQIDP